jgi:SOS-response transcriptional repressor LexA
MATVWSPWWVILFQKALSIVIEPEMKPIPGDYVIALNVEIETTFKQLVKDGGEFLLKPLNTRYPIKP